jgi:hypothetical protein
VELLDPTDPEVRALAAEEDAIRQAHAAYRSDPDLAQDLERTGWWADRTTAAREGRAIRSEGQRQSEPVLPLPTQDGRPPFRPSPWAGFTNLLADVAQRRVDLLEQRRPEILARIVTAEADLRRRVLDTPVGRLDGLVGEANDLLVAAITARGPMPRTVRTASGLAPPRFRERTHTLELADSALAGWSLLDPVGADEPTQLVTSSYGIQPDTTPSGSVDDARRQHQQAATRFGTSRG